MDSRHARERLIEEQRRRWQLAGQLRSHEVNPVENNELSSVDQHQGELATETFERERDLTALTLVEAELGEIQAALRRLDSDGYGHCEVCGKAIPDERLEAKPWARFCIVHQAEAEKARP